MSPAFQSMFNSMGQSLADALLGNPAAAAAEAERRRQEAERQAEEARRRAEERRRVELDLHKRLMSELKLLDDQGSLQPMALGDGAPGSSDLIPIDDDGLAPAGTSFFGLGGGKQAEPPANSVNLRRAAFLAEKAQDAAPEDAALLMDEALQVADGKPAFVEIPDNAAPIISEDGLRAFQQANIDYRRAHSDTLVASQNFDAADRDRRIAEEVRRRMIEERNTAAFTPDRQHLLHEAESAFCRLTEEANRALQVLDQAQSSAAWNDALRRLSLRSMLGLEPVLPEALRKEHDSLDPGIADRLNHDHPAMILFREFASEHYDELLGQQYGFVDDPSMQNRAERIVNRLRAVSAYPDEPKIVRVLDLPKDPHKAAGMEDNAGAVGSRIFIGRNLLNTMDDDTLMFVLAHEMGHNIEDHAIQKFGKVAREMLGGWCDKKTDASGLTPKDKDRLHDQVTAIRIADFTRTQELQADREGAYLALAAGAKPEGIRKFFQWDAQHEVQIIAGLETRFEEKQLTNLTPAQRQARIESGMVKKMPTAERKLQDQLLDHPAAQQRYGTLVEIYGSQLLHPLELN
jgi:hypothetical protein